MRTLSPCLCLLALAGCNGAPPPSGFRTVTSVRWDAEKRPVVSSHVVPLVVSDGVGGGSGSSNVSDMPVDSSCLGSDLILSDAPTVNGAGSVPQLDPNSNWLCLTNPNVVGEVDFSQLDYAGSGGGNWAGKVRAFQSSTQSGTFYAIYGAQTQCQGGFHDYETTNAASCVQTADVVVFDALGAAFTPCSSGSVTCSDNKLNVCDQNGEWQSQTCDSGLTCSVQSASCCVMPVCGGGGLGQACGTTRNSCGTVQCSCAEGLLCALNHCIRQPHGPGN